MSSFVSATPLIPNWDETQHCLHLPGKRMEEQFNAQTVPVSGRNREEVWNGGRKSVPCISHLKSWSWLCFPWIGIAKHVFCCKAIHFLVLWTGRIFFPWSIFGLRMLGAPGWRHWQGSVLHTGKTMRKPGLSPVSVLRCSGQPIFFPSFRVFSRLFDTLFSDFLFFKWDGLEEMELLCHDRTRGLLPSIFGKQGIEYLLTCKKMLSSP